MDEVQPEAGNPVSLSAIGQTLGMEAKLQRLQRWAAERGITGDDWMASALIAAALDHPDIREEKRKRGRPRKGFGLLARPPTPKEREAESLLQAVHRVQIANLLLGRTVTDADALRALSQQMGERPGIPSTEQQIRYRASLLSKARKLRGSVSRVSQKSANLTK